MNGEKTSRFSGVAFQWAVGCAALLLTAALAFEIVSVAFARHYAEVQPEVALAWRGRDAHALAMLAEDEAARARDPQQLRKAADIARSALAAGPLEIRALRTLGLTAVGLYKDRRGETLLTMAGERSQRDIPTHLWLFNHKLGKRDYEGAFAHADVLMYRPAVRRQMVSMLVSLVADPTAADALVARLSRNPPWRSAIIQELARSGDPAEAYAILSRLSATGFPPTDSEAGAVVGGLIAHGRLAEAYLAWVQMLPPEGLAQLADVYDGGFDGLPGAAPFNWSLGGRKGVVARIERMPDSDESALYVRYMGGRSRSIAGQMLLLPQGRYRLSVTSRVEEGAGALQWAVGCHGARQPLAILPDGAASQRQTQTVEFEVREDCIAQSLQLRPTPGVKSDYAVAWVEAVNIERLAPRADS